MLAGSFSKDRVPGALPWLVTALAFLLAFARLDNPDTWWHLAAGRWIARNHAVPSTDVLSFTVPDHPWINLQWLYDLVLYGLHQAGGPALISLATALGFAFAFALLLINMRPFLGPVASSLLALWVGCIVSERFAIRPEVVSLVLVQLTLWVLESARGGRSRRLWMLPLVMLMWVNSHSLFIIGLFVIGCHLVAEISRRLRLPPAAWRATGESLGRTAPAETTADSIRPACWSSPDSPASRCWRGATWRCSPWWQPRSPPDACVCSANACR